MIILTLSSMKGEKMTQTDYSVKPEWLKALFSDGDEGLRKLVESVVQSILQAEMREHLQARPYERSHKRAGFRNGYKPRRLHTRVGRLELMLPQARDGSFSTQLFDRYQRSEKALLSSVMEMYMPGVSTRMVKRITEELCGSGLSSSTISHLVKGLDEEISNFRQRKLEGSYPYIIVDARYEKVRVHRRVISSGVFIAIGINQDGFREVLGFELACSEREDYWRIFFPGLLQRGLRGLQCVSWQHCQSHFTRRLLEKVAKGERKRLLSDLRRLYESDSMEEARYMVQRMAEDWGKRYPKIIDKLEDELEYLLACFNVPQSHRRRLRTTNSLERLNREIRRRTRMVSIFPNGESCLRLIGALLLEQHEEWLSGYRYLDMSDALEAEKENYCPNSQEAVCWR